MKKLRVPLSGSAASTITADRLLELPLSILSAANII